MSSKGEKRLDSGITLEKEPLEAIVGDEDAHVMGHLVMYTVGDSVFPRDWLLERAADLGIPEWVLPTEPWPSTAYKRGVRRVIDTDNRRQTIVLERDQGRKSYDCKLEMTDGDKSVRHVELKVMLPQEETGTEGGEIAHHHLGFFDYDSDSQDVRIVKKLNEDHAAYDKLQPIWEDLVVRMREEFDRMAESHTGQDIRNMLQDITREYTNTVVPLRSGGAVYFFPTHLGDVLDGISQLLNEINALYKTGGKRSGLHTMPVLDTEREREWLEERVEQELEGAVDTLFDAAFEDFEAGEETANEIVRTIVDTLGATLETAEQYNGLLEAELSVEEIMEEKKQEIADEKKEQIVQDVLDHQDFKEVGV